MSAIWGCVDLSGKALPEGLCAAMEKPLHEYKIDRYSSVQGKNVTMGCGVQYVHAESDRESLPVFDGEHGIYFTADCIIDNRPELISELCPDRDDIPDGALLYLAYLKWREDTSRHVIGSYSYAVYDKSRNALIVSADHTNTRSIYYMRKGSRIWFGTIIESVLQGYGELPTLDKEWVAMFLAMVPIVIQKDPTQTPYIGVKRVIAARYRVFSDGGEREEQFWSPEDVQPLRLANDDEYRARFREILNRSASDAVRDSKGEVGILLSSGMDSATVAAVVSPLLEKQGRRLHSYTNIPLDGYVQQYSSRAVTNESEGVKRLCEMYPNILPKFMSCPGIDGFNAISEILPVHEIPYKSLTNIAWIYDLEKTAAADGCRVVLDGQMGNSTVSWGDMATYEKTMLMRGRVIKTFSVMSRFFKMISASRKSQVKRLLSSFVPRAVWRLTNRDYFKESFVSPEMAASVGIGRTDPRLEVNAWFPTILTYAETRSNIFSEDAFAQVSDVDTKFSLKHGIIKRDITRDIRLFEFCIAAPMECFVNDEPATRRGVRKYMKDALPAEFLDEKAPRGRQSGDWLFRIEGRWPELYEEIAWGCRAPIVRPFVDQEKIEQALEKYKDGPGPRDEYEFMRLGAVYAMSCFLQSRKWENVD